MRTVRCRTVAKTLALGCVVLGWSGCAVGTAHAAESAWLSSVGHRAVP